MVYDNDELTADEIERQRRTLNQSLEDLGMPSDLIEQRGGNEPNRLRARSSLVENLGVYLDRDINITRPQNRLEQAKRRLAFARGVEDTTLSNDLKELVGHYHQFRTRTGS